MSRRVLITGSSGYLGRALRVAFEELGDTVIGVDKAPSPSTDHVIDLGSESLTEVVDNYDVVICNAKLYSWEAHQTLATLTRSCIINIASIYGVMGNDPGMYTGTEVQSTPSWYAASKGAMVALTKWQATNFAPVRSNCLCPGGILRGHSEEFVRRYSEKVPLKRMASESDIVPLAVFLASAGASYITGQVICVDGGATVMM